MKAETLLDTLASWLGMPVYAAPLSHCLISRPYLLERAGIPSCGTAILFAIPYLMIEDISDPARNLSLYAVPRDYHGYVKELSDALVPRLTKLFSGNRFALFADHSPIAEVDAAARAGLGVRGENGLLLTRDYGSFVFIAEICTDLDYKSVTGGKSEDDFPAEPPSCERCGACLRACPARQGGEWVAPCLSALTQKKGILTAEEEARLREHPLVWGCDACQMVCPHNRRVQNTPISYFREGRLTHVSLDILNGMTDAEFRSRAYAWRGRAVIQRNLILQNKEEQA